MTRWDRNSTITNSRDLEQQLGSVICLLHQKARTILFLCFLIEISSTPHFILWNYSFAMFNWGDDMFWFYACLVHSANVYRELLSHSCWPYAPGIWESICRMGMVVHILNITNLKIQKLKRLSGNMIPQWKLSWRENLLSVKLFKILYKMSLSLCVKMYWDIGALYV